MMIEGPINPPEDTRKPVYTCAICENPIYEGDDFYDIPDYGCCCTECIDDCKRYDAEPDDIFYELRNEVM